MRYSSKPVGWRSESHRHYLAAKGISTKRYHASNVSKLAWKRMAKEYPPEETEWQYDEYGQPVSVITGRMVQYEEEGEEFPEEVMFNDREYSLRDVKDGFRPFPLPYKGRTQREKDEMRAHMLQRNLENIRKWKETGKKPISFFAKKYFMPVYVYRESTGGMHKGDETDNERRAMYGDTPLEKEPRTEAEQFEYAKDMAKDVDVKEVRLTDNGDFLITKYKKGEGWETDTGTGPLEKKEYEVYENIASSALKRMDDEKRGRFSQRVADNADKRGDGKVDIELLKEIARNANE